MSTVYFGLALAEVLVLLASIIGVLAIAAGGVVQDYLRHNFRDATKQDDTESFVDRAPTNRASRTQFGA